MRTLGGKVTGRHWRSVLIVLAKARLERAEAAKRQRERTADGSARTLVAACGRSDEMTRCVYFCMWWCAAEGSARTLVVACRGCDETTRIVYYCM